MSRDRLEIGKGILGYRRSEVDQMIADRDSMLRQAEGRVRAAEGRVAELQNEVSEMRERNVRMDEQLERLRAQLDAMSRQASPGERPSEAFSGSEDRQAMEEPFSPADQPFLSLDPAESQDVSSGSSFFGEPPGETGVEEASSYGEPQQEAAESGAEDASFFPQEPNLREQETDSEDTLMSLDVAGEGEEPAIESFFPLAPTVREQETRPRRPCSSGTRWSRRTPTPSPPSLPSSPRISPSRANRARRRLSSHCRRPMKPRSAPAQAWRVRTSQGSASWSQGKS